MGEGVHVDWSMALPEESVSAIRALSPLKGEDGNRLCCRIGADVVMVQLAIVAGSLIAPDSTRLMWRTGDKRQTNLTRETRG